MNQSSTRPVSAKTAALQAEMRRADEEQPATIRFKPIAMSIPDAAEIIGIGTTKMKELVRDGRITAIKLDGRTLIRWDALQAFVEALPSTTVAQ